MAKGKNKRLPRRGKHRRNDKHTFLKKEWFQIISPPALKKNIPIGWTCCKQPSGTEVISDFLKGRIAEICFTDITNNPQDITKKIKMIVDDIHGQICATNFYSFELTRDAIYEKLKKRQTLIDVFADVKSADGHIFRIFVQIVTNRRNNQLKFNSYAKSSKVKLVRKNLVQKLISFASEISANNLAFEVVSSSLNTTLEDIAQKIITGCKLQIYKMKTIKRGNVDLKKLVKDAQEGIVEKTKQIMENPEAVNKLTKEVEQKEN